MTGKSTKIQTILLGRRVEFLNPWGENAKYFVNHSHHKLIGKRGEIVNVYLGHDGHPNYSVLVDDHGLERELSLRPHQAKFITKAEEAIG